MPHLSSYSSFSDKRLELDMTKLRSMHTLEAQLSSLPRTHSAPMRQLLEFSPLTGFRCLL